VTPPVSSTTPAPAPGPAQAVGLGYGASTAGLMARKPRQPDQLILTRRRTMFSLDTFADKTFIIWTGISILTLILTTVLGPLQTFLKTTSLDRRQWLICTGVALTTVAENGAAESPSDG
jgi:Cation transporting ATPase, C-terminus